MKKELPKPRARWQDWIKANLAAVGDNVLVDNFSQTSGIYYASKVMGIKVTCRKENNKVRVWRTE